MRKGTAKRIVKAKELAKDEVPDGSAVVVMSVRVEKQLYERLRKLSFDRRQPMTEFMVRGIDLVLKAEKY